MKILNLTQHNSTKEQKEAGVVDLEDDELRQLQVALTFDQLPSKDEIEERVQTISMIASKKGFPAAMIGGALWIISPLVVELNLLGIKPLFAFSTREVVEEPQPDGSVKKVSMFRHKGFVEAF